MNNTSLSRSLNATQIEWTATVALAVVTLLTFTGYASDDPRRWIALALLVALMVVQRWRSSAPPSTRVEHLRLAIMTLLLMAVAALGANPLGIIISGFVFSAHAVFSLPGNTGFLWIGLFSLLTAIYIVPFSSDPSVGLFNAAGTAVGYLFMGAAASAQKRAEQASAESSRLLNELQIAHRRLQEQAAHAEALAVEQERNRLAREMHDALGHQLTVAAVQLEAAQKLLTRDPDKAARMVETVRQQVVEGLAELRRTVARLHSPVETEMSLTSALTHLATRFEDATNIATHLDLPATIPQIDDEPRRALYRAAQEALTNVQRHAQAQNVWLQLTLVQGNGDNHPNAARMCVEDDGIGIASGVTTTGYGLVGLRERATQLRGQLAVSNRPAGGVCVVFEIPLDATKMVK
jgi:signal transduction histidine kinase